jgi:hypothetical protein
LAQRLETERPTDIPTQQRFIDIAAMCGPHHAISEYLIELIANTSEPVVSANAAEVLRNQRPLATRVAERRRQLH